MVEEMTNKFFLSRWTMINRGAELRAQGWGYTCTTHYVSHVRARGQTHTTSWRAELSR